MRYVRNVGETGRGVNIRGQPCRFMRFVVSYSEFDIQNNFLRNEYCDLLFDVVAQPLETLVQAITARRTGSLFKEKADARSTLLSLITRGKSHT